MIKIGPSLGHACSTNTQSLFISSLLEPAKHINDRAVKLLHHTVEARESNTENRTRHSKIKSDGIVVSQNYPITDNYKFLHDKNSQSDNNYNFLHGRNNQSNHGYRFLHVSDPCNYGLIAFLATNQTQVILHSMLLLLESFLQTNHLSGLQRRTARFRDISYQNYPMPK